MSVQKAIRQIVKIQVPDILVNNAGIAHIGNVENTSTADFEKLFSVNVKGVYPYGEILYSSYESQGGVILNMASIAALVGLI